jgi:hypothetical protein
MLSSNKSSLGIPGFLHRPHQVRPRVQDCPVAIGNKTAIPANLPGCCIVCENKSHYKKDNIAATIVPNIFLSSVFFSSIDLFQPLSVGPVPHRTVSPLS